MKKLLTALLCAALSVTVAALAACSDGKSADKVNLTAVTAVNVGLMDEIDYYVVSEPVASTKVKAIESLDFAGDLQELYSDGAGYPQAVIVVKNSLKDYAFLEDFMQAVEDNAEWLLDDSTSAETIVSAVTAHLPSGAEPTFKADDLSKTVISNCGISLSYAADCKAEINSFMEEFNAVSDSSFGTASDSFFFDGTYGTAAYDGSISVYAPDGAPALALAQLMDGEMSFDGVSATYNIVSSGDIQTYVAGQSPAADICILPVNLAVKLLGTGANYTLMGTITHGNLYILGTDGSTVTADNISSLKGKTVGIINIAAVPGLTFKVILKKYGLDYTVIE